MAKSKRKLGCLLLIPILIGVGLGVALISQITQTNKDARTERRLNGGAPIRPVFMRGPSLCQKASKEQVALDHAMIETAKSEASVSARGENPVAGYAISYFAWHYNLVGRRRCPPSNESVSEISLLLDRQDWPQVNTEFNDLMLIERLSPSKDRARRLAEIAFLEWIPPSDREWEDSRPYARQLLADQDNFAMPWGEAAMQEIGADSRLGTSAAYLAVATNPDAALPKVERIMLEKLRRSQANTTQAYITGGMIAAIAPDDGNRLIELGYALARGHSAAEPFSNAIVEMLDERIARPMSPFGLSAAEPTEFCRIAKHIGGKAALAAKSKSFCSNDAKGGDGAPRSF